MFLPSKKTSLWGVYYQTWVLKLTMHALMHTVIGGWFSWYLGYPRLIVLVSREIHRIVMSFPNDLRESELFKISSRKVVSNRIAVCCSQRTF